MGSLENVTGTVGPFEFSAATLNQKNGQAISIWPSFKKGTMWYGVASGTQTNFLQAIVKLSDL